MVFQLHPLSRIVSPRYSSSSSSSTDLNSVRVEKVPDTFILRGSSSSPTFHFRIVIVTWGVTLPLESSGHHKPEEKRFQRGSFPTLLCDWGDSIVSGDSRRDVVVYGKAKHSRPRGWTKVTTSFYGLFNPTTIRSILIVSKNGNRV